MVVRRKDKKKVEATNISSEDRGLTLSTTGQFNRCRLVIVEFASSRDETRRDGQRLIVASRHARASQQSRKISRLTRHAIVHVDRTFSGGKFEGYQNIEYFVNSFNLILPLTKMTQC